MLLLMRKLMRKRREVNYKKHPSYHFFQSVQIVLFRTGKSNLDPEITRQRLEAAQTTFMRSLYGVTERDIMRNVYIR